MNSFRRFIGRIRLKLREKNRIVGWKMTPDEAQALFKSQDKTVLTLFGYSAGYEDEAAMLQTVKEILSRYSPEATILNIGATRGGIGVVYPLAKSLDFSTMGIVSTQVLDYPEEISEAVDRVCFIADEQWGGKLPNSEELSPTSKAMVACSDILIGIGGGEISRDEMLAGKEQGKPVHFYPAEVDHAWAIRRAERLGLPPPDSFWGAAHEIFGEKEE
jgi:hypothetical protein